MKYTKKTPIYRNTLAGGCFYVVRLLSPFSARQKVMTFPGLNSVFILMTLLGFSLQGIAQNPLDGDGNIHSVSYQYGRYVDYYIPRDLNLTEIEFTLKGGGGGNASVESDPLILKPKTCTSYGGEGATATLRFAIGSQPNMIPYGSLIRFVAGRRAQDLSFGTVSVEDNDTGTGACGAGGGGGTAVLYKEPNGDAWKLLAVAGGGGGAYQGMFLFGCVDSHGGKGGRSGESGGDGGGGLAWGLGGTNGEGGTVGGSGGARLAGGGGGHNSDGGGMTECGGGGEKGYPEGGLGGGSEPQLPTTCSLVTTYSGGAGYGGGGAAFYNWVSQSISGGGGGGYSGGGGGGSTGGGGGGGSYLNPMRLSGSVTAGRDGEGSSDGVISYQFTLGPSAPPIARCKDATVTIQGSEVSLNPSLVNDGSYSDYTTSLSFSLNLSILTCSDFPSKTVTMTVTDLESGLTASCQSTVSLNTPSVKCKPTLWWPIVRGWDQTNELTVQTIIDPSFSDLCNVNNNSFSISPATVWDCSGVGDHIVTLTYTDYYGNLSSCSTTVTVVDEAAPFARCVTEIVKVYLDETRTATLSPTVIDNGSSDNCNGQVTLSVSPNQFNCADAGIQVVELTATDADGGTDICQARVEVIDIFPPDPVCKDITVELDDYGKARVYPEDLYGGLDDSCIHGFNTVEDNLFTCDDLGSNSLTLEVYYNFGDIVKHCVSTVTVVDEIPPVVPTALCKNITVQLDENGQATIDLQQIDNGSTTGCNRFMELSASQLNFDCSTLGPQTVTLSVTDENNNISTCSSIVTVQDVMKPVALCRNVTVPFGPPLTVDLVNNGSYDNCGLKSLKLSQIAFFCEDLGENLITLTVTDHSNNVSTCQAIVTVQPEQPEAHCQNMTVNLDESGTATIDVEDINTNSTGQCGLSSLVLDVTQFDCSMIGQNTVTLTATDLVGQTSTCAATVTVRDIDSPKPVTCPAPPSITVEADPVTCGAVVIFDEGVVFQDNCDPNPVVTRVFGLPSGSLFPIGTTNITYRAIDASGNIGAGCTTMVTVLDASPPQIQCRDRITVKFPDPIQTGIFDYVGISAADIMIESSDCSRILDPSLSRYGFKCEDAGENLVTLTIADKFGNSSSCQTIVFVDNEPPVATCKNITVDVNTGPVTITPSSIQENTSLSNCFLMNPPEINIDRDYFSCDDLGSHTVTLTMTDHLGTTTTCQSNVQVIDGGISTLSCGFVYVDLKEDESQTVDLSNLYRASDLCGLVSVIPAQTSATVNCDNYGQTLQIPVTATDVNGNQASCNMRVIVRSPYWANCNQITVELDETGEVYVPASDIANYGDVCGQAKEYYDQTLAQRLREAVAPYNDIDVYGGITYGPEDAGKTFRYLYEITAPSFQKCFANVSVIEYQGPKAVCQDITVALDENGQASITPEQVDGGSTSPVDFTLSLDVTSFSCTDLGPHTVTLTASGNDRTSTCEATVTVVDDTAPTALCKSTVIAFLDENGSVTLTPEQIDDGSSDNCTIVNRTLSQTVFDCFPLGPRSITLTVEDASGHTAACTTTVTVEDNIPPTASCKNITVELGPRGTINVSASQIGGDTYDNCIEVGIRLSQSAFNCSHLGDNTVTLTATDGTNTSTCTATVTVVDKIAPTLVCRDVTVYLDENGTAALYNGLLTESISDNCGVGGGYVSPSMVDCSQAGQEVEVSVNWADVNGNYSNCTAIVTVLDNTPPTALCKTSLTASLDANGEATVQAADLDNGSTDNCGSEALSFTFDNGATQLNFDCGDVNTSSYFVLTVADAAGNVSTCFSQVYVKDEMAPIARCKDVTIELNDSGQATYATDIINDGSSDNCGSVSVQSQTVIATCANIGSFESVFTAIDAAGNTSSCTGTITIVDKIAPTAVCQAVTVELDANGSASVTPRQIDGGSSDNCGIDRFILALTLQITTVQVSTGSTGSGELTGPIDLSGSGDPIQISGPGGTVEVGDPIVIIGPSNPTFGCTDLGEHTVELIAIDAAGNQASCTTTVTVKDTRAPEAACQDMTVFLDASGNATITPEQIDNGSSDNCSIAGRSLDITDFSCDQTGANSVTLTVTDPSGNSASCSATVTVVDNIAPTAVCQDATIYLQDDGTARLGVALIQGGSFDNCLVRSYSVDKEVFGCDQAGPNTVTLTVTDVNGNSSTCAATVTVVDNVPPTAVCRNISVELDAKGTATITPEQIDGGSVDNCGIASRSLSETEMTCTYAYFGNRRVTLTVTDPSGNIATCTANVSVQDNIPATAVCKDITVYLDDKGQVTVDDQAVDGGSYDNCRVDNFSLSKTSFDCANVGPNPVTLSVADPGGTGSTCEAVITVLDNTPPVVVCRDITVQLRSVVGGYLDVPQSQAVVSVSDNCGLERNTLLFSLDCNDVGVYVGTVREYDINGNVGTCTTNITVQEVTPPEMSCQDITVKLDANGSATISATDIDNNSFDDCGGINSLSLDRMTFYCGDLGDNTVTLTGMDIYGNSATCSATVTVVDRINPIALCQDISVMLDAKGYASISAADVDDGSMDNCGVNSRSVSTNMFGIADVGAQTVTLTVSDISGNSDHCAAAITVNKRPVTIAYTGDTEEQYSDQINLSATLRDEVNNQPLSGQKLTFTIGVQSVNATTDASGIATATLILQQGPGNYAVVISFPGNSLYSSEQSSDGFEIKAENAWAWYTGPSFVSTGSSRSSTATILLTATIEDFADSYRGNIANATVNFVNRDGGVINPTPLSVSPLSQTVGTVAYEWTVDIGNADAEQFTIGIQVGNYYFFNNPEEDVVVNVAKALSEEFVTGGGHLELCCSEGAYSGDAGTKNNFGFNIKYNKRGANLVGKIRTLFRRYESDGLLHTYQIKGNQMESLVVQGSYAEFTGKANITDVTDPDNPVSVEGNGSFIVKMNDNGEPGTQDDISFALYGRNGALWFASNWTGNTSTLQNLAGGNLQVYSGRRNAVVVEPASAGAQLFIAQHPYVEGMAMKAFPNPFQSELTLHFNIPEAGPVSLLIFNLQGQVARQLHNGFLEAGEHQMQWSGESESGQALPSGIYLVQLRMGSQVINKKVVFQGF